MLKECSMTSWYRIRKPGIIRRQNETLVAHMLAALIFGFCVTQSQLAVAAENPILEAARHTEAQLDARVGLAIYDTESGASWLYNADERFPMASTFKVLACGALLARSDAGDEDRNRLVPIAHADLVAYSPETEAWVGQEITLEALCSATMRTSDNTAANKVLEALGGPEAVTTFLRSIGDEVTRLDRREPDLNEAAPGD